MKLLFDENLSDRIVPQVIDLYPDSTHIKTLGMIHSDDIAIWNFAKTNDFTIVSKDWDFHQLSLLRGFPPKVIYLDIGNGPTKEIVDILRKKFQDIFGFSNDVSESLLVLEAT